MRATPTTPHPAPIPALAPVERPAPLTGVGILEKVSAVLAGDNEAEAALPKLVVISTAVCALVEGKPDVVAVWKGSEGDDAKANDDDDDELSDSDAEANNGETEANDRDVCIVNADTLL